MTRIELTVDGARVSDDVEPRLLLVQYLRERLGKMLGQFVACLEQRLTSDGSTATAVGAAEPAAEAATVEAPDLAAPTAETAPVTEPVPPPATPPPASPLAGGSPAAPNARGDNDALNLGSAVVPVLAKAYWKQALALLALLVVVLILVL